MRQSDGCRVPQGLGRQRRHAAGMSSGRAWAAQAAPGDPLRISSSARSLRETPPLEQYLGTDILSRIRRVMRAPVKLLGDYSQTLPSNWKLYMENVKDSYHASLLHTFFTTFRLNRLSQKGGIVVSESGGHHVSYSFAADSGGKEYEQAGMRAAQESFGLEEPEIAGVGGRVRRRHRVADPFRVSRPSCCSRRATASRCDGWFRGLGRRASWCGRASVLPMTMRK